MIISIHVLKENQEVLLRLQTPHSVLDEYPNNLVGLYTTGEFTLDVASDYNSLYKKLEMVLEHFNNKPVKISDKQAQVDNISRVHPFRIVLNVDASKDYLEKFTFDEIVDSGDQKTMDLMLNNLVHDVADELLQQIED
jgi:hypothetical protein